MSPASVAALGRLDGFRCFLSWGPARPTEADILMWAANHHRRLRVGVETLCYELAFWSAHEDARDGRAARQHGEGR